MKYRKLNAIMVRDSYPISSMDKCVDYLEDAKVFLTLDASCGYWQVKIPEEGRGYTDMTTFTCHAALFRFFRMPFDLQNVPVLDLVTVFPFFE